MHITAENVHIHLPPGAGLLSLPVRGEVGAFTAEPIARAGATQPPALGEIWPGQGGRYVGILPALGDRPAQYMIASDQEAKLTWGPYSEVDGAGSRHDGRANTKALLAAGGKDFPAARWCADALIERHADFHLPSQAELFLASLYAPQVFSKDSWYWSSTQVDRHNAFVQHFANGISYWNFKGYECRVRAVRWIQL